MLGARIRSRMPTNATLRFIESRRNASDRHRRCHPLRLGLQSESEELRNSNAIGDYQVLGVFEKLSSQGRQPTTTDQRSEAVRSPLSEQARDEVERLSKMISLAMACQLQSVTLKSINCYQDYWQPYTENPDASGLYPCKARGSNCVQL